MHSVECCDDLVHATWLLQAPQLKPGPWRIWVVGKGGALVPGDSGLSLVLVILLLLFTSDRQVIGEWRTLIRELTLEVTGSLFGREAFGW